MEYSLPKTVNINNREYAIRYDYRSILDILVMLNDPELSSGEKGLILLNIFYVDPATITDYDTAVKEAFRFIDGGREEIKGKSPRLVDWEQDLQYIISPVNRVLGKEIREENDLHWWTFLSAYMEIGGECLFSQIVSIRDKKSRGKKLEKYELEWLKKNRSIVEFKQKFTKDQTDLINQWTGGGDNNA